MWAAAILGALGGAPACRRRPSAAADADAHPGGDAGTRAAGLTAAVDRSRLRAGEILTYTLEAHVPAGVEVEIEALAAADGLTLVDVRNDPAEAVATGGALLRRVIRLRCDAAGDRQLPRGRARARPAADPGAAAHSLVGPEIGVHVAAHLAAADLQGDLVDLDPLEPLRLWPRWLPWAAAGVGIVATAAALALWRRRRRRRRPLAAPPPPAPAPEVVARAALAAAEGLIGETPAAARALCFALSDIVRAYVEARLGLNATDLTYEEIVARLGDGLALAGDEARLLRDLLRRAEAGKFARWQPDPEAQRALWEDSGAFVAATSLATAAAARGPSAGAGETGPGRAAP